MADKYYDFYTVGKIGNRELCFPEDMVWCKFCDCAYKDSMGRAKCSVLDRQIFDLTTHWSDCPIMFDGTIRGTKRNDDEYELRRAAV